MLGKKYAMRWGHNKGNFLADAAPNEREYLNKKITHATLRVRELRTVGPVRRPCVKTMLSAPFFFPKHRRIA